MQITKENLTIIIVTIKSEKIIDSCLKSIDPKIKKIIVENSSNQGFIESLKQKYENIECYVTGKNLGMGAGNNFGINKSNTRYVMILNPDVILKPNTLDNIFKVSKNLDFAILSPLSDNKDYPNYKKKISNLEKNQQDLFEVSQIDGYSMILDKDQFNNNFFDENIFMYLENDDLCLRVRKSGKKIYLHSKSLITHLGAKAVDEKYFDQLEYSRNWHWNWSKFYFRKKHFGFTKAFLFGILIFFKSILKSIFFSIIQNRFKSKLYYYRASGFLNALLNKRSWFRPRFD